MKIVFNLSHVFNSRSNAEEDAVALRALLNALIQIDLAYLRCHPGTPELYRSGVTYGRTSEWEPIPDVMARRYGDCKSLSAWRIAELIYRGIYKTPPVPVFRWVRRNDGTNVKDFHILVQSPNGFECPSKTLGMTGVLATW